jgi:hypothetical protein
MTFWLSLAHEVELVPALGVALPCSRTTATDPLPLHLRLAGRVSGTLRSAARAAAAYGDRHAA